VGVKVRSASESNVLGPGDDWNPDRSSQTKGGETSGKRRSGRGMAMLEVAAARTRVLEGKKESE
jgi:hypothetical protein